MKIWIEHLDGSLFLHMTEPAERDEKSGWISQGGYVHLGNLIKQENDMFKKHIKNGQVAEFELKTLWEPT